MRPTLPARTLCLALLAAAVLLAACGRDRDERPDAPPASEPEEVTLVTPRGNAYLAGPVAEVTTAVAGDVYAAGGTVAVSAEVARNAVLAGGTVTVARRVAGDVLAAGGTVSIAAPLGDDARLAGGTVSIGGPVTGDLLAAGGDVTVLREASVGGSARLAGGTVEVRGRVAGPLTVRGETVRLEGTVQGDVDVEADTLVVGARADVQGQLTYASPHEAAVDPAARIAGPITRRPPTHPREREARPWAATGFAVLVALALLVTATVLRYVFPGLSVQAARTLSHSPWKSLGLGFALFVCVPAAMLALVVMVVGIPLALILAIVYPLALGLAKFVFAVWMAETAGVRLFGRQPVPIGWQVGLLWLAVLVLAVAWLIPWAGLLIQFVVVLFGLGALGLHLLARYRGGGTAPLLR